MFISVTMYESESLTIKNSEHWRTDALELWCWRRLKSLLDWKEIKPVNPKENKPRIFIGRTHAEVLTVKWLEKLYMRNKTLFYFLLLLPNYNLALHDWYWIMYIIFSSAWMTAEDIWNFFTFHQSNPKSLSLLPIIPFM